MRYFGFTPVDPNGPPPSPELYQRMDELVADATKAGVMLATGGAVPSPDTFRVKYADGEFTVTDGPFTEAKELVGGWAVMDCRDRAEMEEWVKRFLTAVGGGESTIWPVQ